jgi:DNA end-binding protein Ku
LPNRSKKKTNDSDEGGRARPFWSGTLSFGLVSIPVDLYSGSRSGQASFRLLGPEGELLSRRYYSAKTGRDLADDEMVRGYEVERDQYVLVTDEELERLAPEQSRDIALKSFVPLAEIPPLYFDRSYFLAPAQGSAKAYRLLSATLQKEELAGIATFVMRGREYLVAIFPENGILRAETMRFADEIRTAQHLGLPRQQEAPAATIKKFEKIIARHASPHMPIGDLKDERTEQLMQLAKKKRTVHQDVVKVETAEPEGKVVDLVAALKKSLTGKRKVA